MSAPRLDLLLLGDLIGDLRFRNRQYTTRLVRAWEAIGLTDADRTRLGRGADCLQPLWHRHGDAERRYGLVLPQRPLLGMADLATVCAAAGFSVRVVDNFTRLPWRFAEAKRIVAEASPRLVGISTTLLAEPLLVERLVRLVRSIAPDAGLVIGGPTVRAHPQLCQLADYAVFGAGERPLVELLEALSGGGGSLDAIADLVRRDEAGELHHGPNAARAAARQGVHRVRTDERIPIVDWRLYPRSRALVYPIELSRGCRYNCGFCSHQRGSLARPLDEVRRELLTNAELGITRYRVSDANFTSPIPGAPRYPHQICELMIELDLGLEWSAYARVDDLDEELADLMVRAGCMAVFFGLESGSDRILKAMGKGHDVAASRRAVELARSRGLYVHENLIIGYPGETRESYEETLALIAETRPQGLAVSQFTVDPDSPIGRAAERPGNLTGIGMRWRHDTMDAEAANALVAEAYERLWARGLGLGHEYALATWRSYGLEVETVARVDVDIAALSSAETPAAARQAARERMRALIFGPVAQAVAADRRAMEGG